MTPDRRNGHIPDFAKTGILITTAPPDNGLIRNPKDQTELVRAIREHQRQVTTPELQNAFDRLNTWSDRIKGRFFDGVLRLDRNVLPTPIIAIAPMRIETLAAYHLVEDEIGAYYKITMNAKYFEKGEWILGGEYGMVEVQTHETGHLWQQEGGGKDPYIIGKSKGNGHNLEFRGKMGSIGIHCNDRGQHTQAADGDFERFMNGYGYQRPDVPEPEGGLVIDWWKLIGDVPKGRSSLSKWVCPECNMNLRVGKRGDVRVICGGCRDKLGYDVWFVRG